MVYIHLYYQFFVFPQLIERMDHTREKLNSFKIIQNSSTIHYFLLFHCRPVAASRLLLLYKL